MPLTLSIPLPGIRTVVWAPFAGIFLTLGMARLQRFGSVALMIGVKKSSSPVSPSQPLTTFLIQLNLKERSEQHPQSLSQGQKMPPCPGSRPGPKTQALPAGRNYSGTGCTIASADAEFAAVFHPGRRHPLVDQLRSGCSGIVKRKGCGSEGGRAVGLRSWEKVQGARQNVNLTP